MNDFSKQIKYWFSKYLSRPPSYESKSLKPKRDWVILLSASCIVLLSLGVFALYFYIEVSHGRLFIVSQDEFNRKAKINTPLLNKTVEDINTRATRMADMKVNSINVPDPSL